MGLIHAFARDEDLLPPNGKRDRLNVLYAAKHAENLPPNLRITPMPDPAKDRNYAKLKERMSKLIWIKSDSDGPEVEPLEIQEQHALFSPYLNAMIEARKDGLQVDMDGASYPILFPRQDIEVYITYLEDGIIMNDHLHSMLETEIIGYMGHSAIRSLDNKDLVSYWRAKLKDEYCAHQIRLGDVSSNILPVFKEQMESIIPSFKENLVPCDQVHGLVPEYKAIQALLELCSRMDLHSQNHIY